MAAIDFPNSPEIDELFSVDNRTWKWNGTVWQTVTTTTGSQGDKAGHRYEFSDNTTVSQPIDGSIKFNNSSATAVTTISISNETKNGTNISDFLQDLDSSDSLTKFYLTLSSNNNYDPTFTIFRVGDVTVNSGWTELSVLYVSGTTPSNGEQIVLNYDRTGDAGVDGIDGLGYDITLTADLYTEPGYTWMTDNFVSLVETQKIIASDGVDQDYFGQAVAVSADGNTAIVSAFAESTDPNSNQGAAYIYVKSGSTWVEEAKLLGSGRNDYDYFGASVAISGDGNTAVVGAIYSDIPGYANNGAAYVFTRSGSTWTEEAYLANPVVKSNSRFGDSVNLSSDGNTLVVGSPSSGNPETGAAYVFTRSSSVWSYEEELLPSDGAVGDYFGISVSISGDGNIAAIGAQYKGSENKGGVYIFNRSGGIGGVWNQKSIVQPVKPIIEQQFGINVALSTYGDTLAVSGSGSDKYVYVFNISNSEYIESAKLYTKEDPESYNFGSKIALSGYGEILLVSSGNTVYSFFKKNNKWYQKQKMKPSDTNINNQFGSSLAISNSGESAIIGDSAVSMPPSNSSTYRGAAYCYSLLISKLEFPFDTDTGAYTDKSIVQAISTENTANELDGVLTLMGSGMSYITPTSVTGSFVAGASYEIRLNSIGKIGKTGADGADGANGLGYDVVVPAFYSNVETQKLLASDSLGGDNFGTAVAISTDGNTAIVSAYGESTSPNFYNGASYIYVKSGSTWIEQAKLLASDRENSDQSGASVDISDDGNTVIIGVPYESTSPNTSQGSAYIFTRSGSTWTEQAKLVGLQTYSNFANSVSISGDGNKAVIGSPGEDTGSGTDSGAARVFTRSGSTWTLQATILASDIEAQDEFGFSVAISGDGSTIAIGSPSEDSAPNSTNGAAYVYTYSGSAWVEEAKLLASDRANYDRFGQSVSISGDGNTILVGSPWEGTQPAFNENGAAYVFTRVGSTWTQEDKLVDSEKTSYVNFGLNVALSSDGNTALLGSYTESFGNLNNLGAMLVFTRSSSIWTKQQKLFASDIANDNFGRAMSISGDGNTILAGASSKDETDNDNGAAYIFDLNDAPALIWGSNKNLGAYVNLGYVKAVDSNNSSNYILGTLNLPKRGIQYVRPDVTTGSFILGNSYSIRLNVAGIQGPEGPNPLPSYMGNDGKFLTTDGLDVFWENVDALPLQTGNSGKYLTTDGTDPSWEFLAGAVYQDLEPTGPLVGQIWVDSNASVSGLNSNDFLLKTDAEAPSGYLLKTDASGPSGYLLKTVASSTYVVIDSDQLIIASQVFG